MTIAQQSSSQRLATHVPKAAQTAKGKTPAGAKQVSANKSKASKQSKTPNAADARKKAVYRAMEQLLEHGAFSDADLLRSIPNLSGDEFLQVLLVFLHSASCTQNFVAITYIMSSQAAANTRKLDRMFPQSTTLVSIQDPCSG